MCLTLCVTTFADSNVYWEDGPYDVIWNEKENAMWWKKYSFLLMYPMAVFGVVGSSYYASGQLNTFDKWYLIVFVPLGLWQWIETFVRWRRERRTPPEDGVKPKDDDGPTARTP